MGRRAEFEPTPEPGPEQEPEKPHCRFREEDGTCAISRQLSSKLEKPLCNTPEGTTDTCETAIGWRKRDLNPIDMGLVPPMGEI